MLTGLIFGCSHWKYFHSSTLWKDNQIFCCTLEMCSFRLICRFVFMSYACLQEQVHESKYEKMVSWGFKQDRNHAVTIWKSRYFLWCNKINVSIYEKKLFVEDAKDSNVNQSLFALCFSLAVQKALLQSSQKYCRHFQGLRTFLSCIQKPT